MGRDDRQGVVSSVRVCRVGRRDCARLEPRLARDDEYRRRQFRRVPIHEVLSVVVGLDARVSLLPHRRSDCDGVDRGAQTRPRVDWNTHRVMRRVIPLLALVIVSNIVMLAAVRANRTGEPDAVVTLTERELHLERTSDRDSALKLRLETVTNPSSWSEENQMLSWLTPAMLATLGFKCGQPTDGSTVAPQPCGLA